MPPLVCRAFPLSPAPAFQIGGGQNIHKKLLKVAIGVIEESRLLRLQPFNEYRKRFSLVPYTSFQELTGTVGDPAWETPGVSPEDPLGLLQIQQPQSRLLSHDFSQEVLLCPTWGQDKGLNPPLFRGLSCTPSPGLPGTRIPK